MYPMGKKINTSKAMMGTPRPHYLVGDAEINKEENRFHFLGRVNFTSKEHPSILDRTDKYVSKPHVNAGDCCFALWNAVHVIAEDFGYGSRILRDKILIEPKRLIPPDTELSLEVLVEEEKELTLKGINFSVGTIYGKFSFEGKSLLDITANYCAEIIHNDQI